MGAIFLVALRRDLQIVSSGSMSTAGHHAEQERGVMESERAYLEEHKEARDRLSGIAPNAIEVTLHAA